MHSIERYGIVALLFLVVTVVAVLMWDGGKGKKKESLAGGPAASAAARPPARAAEGRRAGGRLSLVADPQPGPLARQPDREVQAPAAGELPPAGPLLQSPGAASAPTQDALPPAETPPATGPQRVEPVREPIVGRAPATSSHAYTVRAGDTLSEIAQRELGSSRRWQEIVALNPGLDPARLRVGKPIQIPGAAPAAGTRTAAAPERTQPAASEASRAARTWKVGRGENLWKIAERALGDGKRWREIAALNPRVNPDRLKLGQVLTLPAAPAKKDAPARNERPTLVASGGGERQAQRGGRVR